jgi:hypothetical protein
LPAEFLGVCLGVADYLLRGCARVGANLFRLPMRAGHVFVSRSLGEIQHLERLPLDVGMGSGIGWGIGLLLWLIGGLIHNRCPAEQPFDPALHSTIGHRMTSLRERFDAPPCVSSNPLSTRPDASAMPLSAQAFAPECRPEGRDVIKLNRILREEKPNVSRRARGVR